MLTPRDKRVNSTLVAEHSVDTYHWIHCEGGNRRFNGLFTFSPRIALTLHDGTREPRSRGWTLGWVLHRSPQISGSDQLQLWTEIGVIEDQDYLLVSKVLEYYRSAHKRLRTYGIVASWRHPTGQCSYKGYIYCQVKIKHIIVITYLIFVMIYTF